MNMVVCVKQVPDPEAPPASFGVDAVGSRVVLGKSVPLVISPFDEQAVEAALRLKDAHVGTVTVMTLGPRTAREVLKYAIAMGADEGVLLEDNAFEDSDSAGTAYALALAIRKLGPCDLVFCGRLAADWDAGQVGTGIAHYLGVPCVTLARKVELLEGGLIVERIITDGYEVVQAPMPAVVTVSSELGTPRRSPLKRILAAAKKEVTTWSAEEVGADPQRIGAAGRLVKPRTLFVPRRTGTCEIVEADSPAQAAEKLAAMLRAAKII
jgi:electron transfer flavoprotein beta subunit